MSTSTIIPASVVRRMKADVAAALGISVDDMMGSGKGREIAVARWMVMRAMRDRGASLPQIGRALDRHHTTVLSSLRALEEASKQEPSYRHIAARAASIGRAPADAMALVRMMRDAA